MHRMLIDGKLVTADRTYPSVNPATGQVIDHAPDASVADAQAAIAAARRAFDTTSWATDAALRARCLDQLHRVLTEHKEELRELTIADVGAPRVITYGAQLEEPIAIVRYYADLLPGYPLTEEIGTMEFRGQRHRRWVEKEPPAWSPRSSATTTRRSWRWPSCRLPWRPAARWCSRPRRTRR